jgi:5'-nucleotidase
VNVNVPAGERKGVRVVRLSTKPRHDTFERRISPRGRLYYWPDWRQVEDDEEGTDVWAFVRGYITVTPMTLDVTAPDEMRRLSWLESK